MYICDTVNITCPNVILHLSQNSRPGDGPRWALLASLAPSIFTVMLPKVLLAALFGAQVVAGAVIAQQGSTPVEVLEFVEGDRWSYEECGACLL